MLSISAELGFVYQEVACSVATMKGPGQPRAFTVNGAWAPNPRGFMALHWFV